MFLDVKCLELGSFLKENPVPDGVQLQTPVTIEGGVLLDVDGRRNDLPWVVLGLLG